MTYEPQHLAPILGPGHSSFRSLFCSLLEPNVLILVGYLVFNLHLAAKCLRVATSLYASKTIIPPLAHSSSGPIQHALASDSEGLDLQEQRSTMSTTGTRKSDTRLTQLLIAISTWAFRDQASNAKTLTALLAVASLVSTWHYMFAYLSYSYQSYISRCHLTSYPLSPAPDPLSWERLDLIVPSLHLRVLRISQWLGSLSLFEEAWLEVVRDRNAWWWSSEICIITVGSWAVFLRSESKRLKIPHVATFMALGQLVAIGFAYNLFQLAVLYRLDTEDLIPGSSHSGSVTTTVTIQSAEAQAQAQRRELPRTESELLMPPPASPPGASVTHTTTAATTTTATTSITVQRIPLAPRLSFSVRLGGLMAKVVPERIALPVFLLGGLYSVFSGPDTLSKVLMMHVFPMLLVLYPIRRMAMRKLKSSAAFGHATASSASRFVRSKRKVPLYLDPKLVHLGLALGSVALRVRSVYGVVADVQGSYDVPVSLDQRLWQSTRVVYPQTFHRHPAVSSIGSDHVAVLASVVSFILLESGLWMWKDAKTSPSARLSSPGVAAATAAEAEAAVQPGATTTVMVAPTSVTLDRLDRSRLEFQSRFVLVVVVLAPVWGASASLGFYLALRETWMEDDEQFQQQQQRAHAKAKRERGEVGDEEEAEVEAEKVTGQVLETLEGERVLEIRQRKVNVVAASSPVGVGEGSKGQEGDTSVSGGEGSFDGEGSKRTRRSVDGATGATKTTGARARVTRKSVG